MNFSARTSRNTVVVDVDGKQEKVRLIGVDTPETVHPKKPVEYFGKEASEFTKNIVDGKQLKSSGNMRERQGRIKGGCGK
jgi:micrococcal nuclease